MTPRVRTELHARLLHLAYVLPPKRCELTEVRRPKRGHSGHDRGSRSMNPVVRKNVAETPTCHEERHGEVPVVHKAVVEGEGNARSGAGRRTSNPSQWNNPTVAGEPIDVVGELRWCRRCEARRWVHRVVTQDDGPVLGCAGPKCKTCARVHGLASDCSSRDHVPGSGFVATRRVWSGSQRSYFVPTTSETTAIAAARFERQK